MEDLKYLIKVLDELGQSARDSMRLRHQQSHAARFAEAERSYGANSRHPALEEGWWIDNWEASEESSLEDALERMTVRIRAEHKDFGRVVEGPAEAILGEIDLTDLVSLRLSVGKSLYSGTTPAVQVRMDRANGVEVEIRDQGSDWVRVAESKLKTAVAKHRPWYWWMRSSWVLIPLFFLPVHVVARVMFIKERIDLSGEVTLGVFEALVTIGLVLLWQKLMPGFELFKVGSRARAARILAMIGTLALSVAGIIVPLLMPSSK
jgi:hypothetical protein